LVNAYEQNSIYALFAFGSNALSPLLAGFITNSLGWRAAIWFGVISLATSTIIIFFGFEETLYFRNSVEGIYSDNSVADDAKREIVAVGETTDLKPLPRTYVTVQNVAETVSSSSQAQSYLSKLKLFRSLPGRPTVKEMLLMMYRPLIMFFYFPSLDWAGFLYGINLSWYTVLNGTMSAVLSAAPYRFSSSIVGLSYISPLIGSLLGALWGGWVGDKVAIYLARRNGGVREAEHRLWVLILSAIIGASGFILWGVGAANEVHWSGPVVGCGMVEFAIVVGASVSLAYGIDCFKEIAGESIILIIVIRNTIGFGFSYGITPWLAADGYTKTFVAVAMLSLGTTLTFLLMVFFGKSLRKMSAKKYWEYADTLVVGGSH
jgi:MFS family permease